MQFNKIKNELHDDLNHLLGLLITLRQVESTNNLGRHWVNHYIDTFSVIRNKMFADEDECKACNGSGADYPKFAESTIDAIPCEPCHGLGFNSVPEIKQILTDLKNESTANKSTSILTFVNDLLEKKVFAS